MPSIQVIDARAALKRAEYNKKHGITDSNPDAPRTVEEARRNLQDARTIKNKVEKAVERANKLARKAGDTPEARQAARHQVDVENKVEFYRKKVLAEEASNGPREGRELTANERALEAWEAELPYAQRKLDETKARAENTPAGQAVVKKLKSQGKLWRKQKPSLVLSRKKRRR